VECVNKSVHGIVRNILMPGDMGLRKPSIKDKADEAKEEEYFKRIRDP